MENKLFKCESEQMPNYLIMVSAVRNVVIYTRPAQSILIIKFYDLTQFCNYKMEENIYGI